MKIPVVSKAQEDAAAHFGWMTFFAGLELTGSSSQTQEALGWRPTQVGLIEDLDHMNDSGQ